MLNKPEIECLNLISDAWNKFCELPIQHLDDACDFADAIHNCQRIIMAREAVRSNNGIFRVINEPD
jgi:hypothetical protein